MEHGSCSGATHIFECFNHPFIDFVFKFIEVDIVFAVVVEVAIHIDGVAGENRSQFNIEATLTNSERHLVGAQEHLSVFAGFIQADRGNLSGAQCALDKELRVTCIVDYIDIFVAQFSHDTVNACALHTHASAHRVDTVVVAFHGNFGAFARYACHGANHDKAIVDFRHFEFKQAAEEVLAGARHGDFRIVVFVVHIVNHGTHGFALAIDIGRNLLVLRQEQFIFIIVEQEHFALPHLVHFAAHQFTFLRLELGVDSIFLQVKDFACQCLAKV